MQTTRLPTTELGETGLEITRVGFGAWAIGGAGYDWGWAAQEDDDSVAAVHHALELGVNWVDSRRAQGGGPRPSYRRLQLQRRPAAADPADRSCRDAAAALLAGRAGGRAGAAAVRRARGYRCDRLLTDGIWPAHRRDDPRANRAAARRRLAKAQPAL